MFEMVVRAFVGFTCRRGSVATETASPELRSREWFLAMCSVQVGV